MKRIEHLNPIAIIFILVICSSCRSPHDIQLKPFSTYSSDKKYEVPIQIDLTEEFRNYSMKYIIDPTSDHIEYIQIGQVLAEDVRILVGRLFENVQSMNLDTSKHVVTLTPEVIARNHISNNIIYTNWSKVDLIMKINWVFRDIYGNLLYQQEVLTIGKSKMGNTFSRAKVLNRGIQETLDELFLASYRELASSKDFQDFVSWASFHYATFANELEKITSFIKAGVAPDISDNKSTTALMIAAQENHLDISKYLLSEGAKINAQNKEGGTPLMFAAQEGQLSMVNFLLKSGARVDLLNRFGGNALMGATSNGHAKVVERLLEAGADPSIQTRHGITALMLAAQSGDNDTRKLLEKKLNINYDYMHSYTPSTEEIDIFGRVINTTKFHPDEIQNISSFERSVISHSGSDLQLTKADEKDSTCVQFLVRFWRQDEKISSFILKKYLNSGCNYIKKVDVFSIEGETTYPDFLNISEEHLVFTASELTLEEETKMINFGKLEFLKPEIQDNYFYDQTEGWEVERNLFIPLPSKL